MTKSNIHINNSTVALVSTRLAVDSGKDHVLMPTTGFNKQWRDSFNIQSALERVFTQHDPKCANGEYEIKSNLRCAIKGKTHAVFSLERVQTEDYERQPEIQNLMKDDGLIQFSKSVSRSKELLDKSRELSSKGIVHTITSELAYKDVEGYLYCSDPMACDLAIVAIKQAASGDEDPCVTIDIPSRDESYELCATRDSHAMVEEYKGRVEVHGIANMPNFKPPYSFKFLMKSQDTEGGKESTKDENAEDGRDKGIKSSKGKKGKAKQTTILFQDTAEEKLLSKYLDVLHSLIPDMTMQNNISLIVDMYETTSIVGNCAKKVSYKFVEMVATPQQAMNFSGE